MKTDAKIVLVSIVIAIGVLIVLAGLAGSLYLMMRIWRPGIDVTGGTSLVYEIDVEGMTAEEQKDLSDKMIAVLRRRMNYVRFRPLGDTRLEILVPPSYPVEDVKRFVKGSGTLEFRILPTYGHPMVDTNELQRYVEEFNVNGPNVAPDSNYLWCELENPDDWRVQDGEGRYSIIEQFGDKFYALTSNRDGEIMINSPGVGGWKLDKVYVTYDGMGRRAIGFEIDERGGRLLAEVTGNNIDRPMCIILDDIAVSAPMINDRIPYGRGIIQGRFTQIQVEDMVNKLNAGRLPAKLIEEPVSEKPI